MLKNNNHKIPYVIPCSNSFKKAVLELAHKKKVNAGDLARSVFLIFSQEQIENFPDAAEPSLSEREEIILKTGILKGQKLKRKPRLQVRMPEGLTSAFIRKALLIALALERNELFLELEQSFNPKKSELNDEIERLKTTVAILAFEPLRNGIKNKNDALFVLGFPPNSKPDLKTTKLRFRMLASIFHPDSIFGSHERMSNINSAMDFLVKQKGQTF